MRHEGQWILIDYLRFTIYYFGARLWRISLCSTFRAMAGFPNVITFTGLSEGVGPEAGMRHCVEGYKRVIAYAEQKGVNVCLEMLNSRVNVEMVGVPGYQGDHTDYCMEIVRRVGRRAFYLMGPNLDQFLAGQ